MSLTVDSTGKGVGVYTDATSALLSSTIWSGGAWSVPASVNANANAMGQPFIDATGGTTSHLVYQDNTYHYWYLAHTGGAWSTAPQALNVYGPVPATVAARGTDATAAFIDGRSGTTNFAAEEDLTGGVWQTPADVTTMPESFTVPATIIPLSAGPDLMMVFVQQDTKIMFATRTGTTWSPAAYINNCLTNDRVALASLPNGGAILAFRGTDTNLYWSIYSGGAWSTVAPFATPNVPIDTSPAVTHGIGGDTAEIAYLSKSTAYHARLTGSTWSAPVLVGGAMLNGVAIAAAP